MLCGLADRFQHFGLTCFLQGTQWPKMICNIGVGELGLEPVGSSAQESALISKEEERKRKGNEGGGGGEVKIHENKKQKEESGENM